LPAIRASRSARRAHDCARTRLRLSKAEPARRARMALGIACGTGAAVFWAAGFAAVRHGIAAGLSPWDIVFHRYVWAGLFFLPFLARRGLSDLGGVGLGRGVAITLCGGPTVGLLSFAGFLLVPLGHGGVIQPSCAALGGLLLAATVLREPLSALRLGGALLIVVGLMVIGAEALATIGTHGLLGDLMFVAAGLSFATFGLLLRLWRISPLRAVDVVSVVSLAYAPVQWALIGFANMASVGLFENLLQVVVQGMLAGPVSTYLFARSVTLLGAGRAAVFASLVPGFTLLIGYLILHEPPTAMQLLGFLIVLIGFRLTQTS
jgi:drug/metabolite transporter (DMT)-like permease